MGRTTSGVLGAYHFSQGVATDSSKVECMLSWKQPRAVRELRGFLGLTSYYRRFVDNCGKTVASLTVLLKKDAFEWTNVAIKAFEELKIAMAFAPVSALPDFTMQFMIECDVSSVGIGAVLM
ncbi:uncharacterized mitochondrial protein AtMg00860-like [Typha latifolia]|uniref:uncharacterized mitochondrial protein AtMg00860-like n=1 Tax=Typha latifolia TaxID=4733 RepID=UPI003C2D9973